VEGQREAVARLERGVELLHQRGVDADQAAPRRKLDLVELGLRGWHGDVHRRLA
jgi:hypothetical protein